MAGRSGPFTSAEKSFVFISRYRIRTRVHLIFSIYDVCKFPKMSYFSFWELVSDLCLDEPVERCLGRKI